MGQHSADWVVPYLRSQHHTPPPSLCAMYVPIHELILIMSRQCTNPGPSHLCSICHRMYIKSQYIFQCSSCQPWVHKKCPGLAKSSLHHSLWFCHKYQTPSASPPAGKPTSTLLPSPTSIPPRFLPPTGKGAVSFTLSASLPLRRGHFSLNPPLFQRVFSLPEG